MGVMGLSPLDYTWACVADLAAIARGYGLRHRDDWERTLLLLNAWVTKPLKYDEIFGGKKTTNRIKSNEEWQEFVAKRPLPGRKKDG